MGCHRNGNQSLTIPHQETGQTSTNITHLDTENTINGRLTKEGINLKLERELPQIIKDNIEGFCVKLMGFANYTEKDYNRMFWAVHPGSPAILNRLEKKLELLPDKLNAS